jgi:hypothetical protein
LPVVVEKKSGEFWDYLTAFKAKLSGIHGQSHIFQSENERRASRTAFDGVFFLLLLSWV